MMNEKIEKKLLDSGTNLHCTVIQTLTCCQWLNWHHASHVLLAGTNDGEMWMWLVPHGNTRTFPSYGSPSLCGAFLHDGEWKYCFVH